MVRAEEIESALAQQPKLSRAQLAIPGFASSSEITLLVNGFVKGSSEAAEAWDYECGNGCGCRLPDNGDGSGVPQPLVLRAMRRPGNLHLHGPIKLGPIKL